MKKYSLFIKMAGFVLAAALVLATVVGLLSMGHDGFSGFIKPFLAIMAGGGLVILLIIYTILKDSYDSKHKYAEMNRIMAEKGICDEYIEAYKAAHPNMSAFDRIQLADLLTTVRRYDEAERILSSMKLGFFSSDDLEKATYCVAAMNLYLNTERYADSFELLKKEKSFLNIFFQSPVGKQSAPAYYDCAACTCAANGYEGTAEEYIQMEERWAEKHDSLGFYVPITRIAVKNLTGDPRGARADAEELRRKIESCEKLQSKAAKDAYFRMIENAVNYK